MSAYDEVKWLIEHSEFKERPATLDEFLGAKYLDIESRVRARVRQELVAIMGTEVSATRPTAYQLAMITGGIGIGKTTIASIVLPYLAHWTLCLKDPQGFFDLLPGSRIAYMQMSTSESQAKEVIFGDIKARIQHSPWFKTHPWDPNFKNQLRFENDIWILPGDSAETTFEGYNVLGGILDEADSHKVTQTKDYAENGYNTIFSRMTSRFQDRGFLLVIGQMKSSTGFAARKYAELSQDSKAYTARLAIWESFGWDFYRDKETGKLSTFFYDTKRKITVPSEIAKTLSDPADLIEVPGVYLPDFKNNPEKALKDLAGRPPAVGDPFISLVDKIEAAQARWHANRRHTTESPVDVTGRIARWFVAKDGLKRVCHVDIGYSADGDALGFAMAHVAGTVDRDGEMKPYIVVDMALRWHAAPGNEIFLPDIRRMIYSLKDDRRFKLVTVTYDGFESTEMRQQLARKRFQVETVSVDKNKLPYSDLRDAIYEDRIEFPKYMVEMRFDDHVQTNIIYKELSELTDTGRKIDHPVKGSKDVADALAGCAYTLMGDRSYRKRTRDLDQAQSPRAGAEAFRHHAYTGAEGAQAPIPPNIAPRGDFTDAVAGFQR